MEEHFNGIVPEIPETWRVSGDAFPDPISARSRTSFRPDANATFAEAQRQPVCARVVVVMAGPA